MPAITMIEGVGEVYADKLAQAKIGTTQALLERGATRRGRQEIAKIAGVDGRLVLLWVNRADLFRIRGVGEEYSDLLEASGVDTVVELAQRNPEHLVEKMREVNEQQKLVRKPPTLPLVSDWVAEAKTLPRVVEY